MRSDYMVFNRNDFKPIYFQLAEKIKRDIDSGVIRQGSKLPTEEELASEMRICRPTVRSALKKLEAEGYLFRVRGKGTFASLPQKREKRIIIASEAILHQNRNLHSVVAGIITRAQNDGIKIHLARKDELPDVISGIRNNEQFQSGIIFIHNYTFDESLLKEMDKLNIPWLIEGGEHPFNCSYVDIDNDSAMRKVVDHLVDFGHKDIAVLSLSNPLNSHLAQRHESAISRIKEKTGAFDSKRLFVIPESRLTDGTDEACAELFKRGKRPTAIVCVSDTQAVRVVLWLTAHGISVPGNVSVTGFDDLLEYNKILRPRLTTVRLDYFDMGMKASDTLISMMDNFQNHRMQLKMDLELIIRGSTGKNNKVEPS